MHDLCCYFDKVIGDEEKMRKLEEIACEVMRNLGALSPELHKQALYKMHIVVFGEHFDEKTAECVVSEFENADGTIGPHWSRKDSDTMAHRLGVKETDDFYVAVNHFYRCFGTVLGSDSNVYAKMAKSVIDNRNGMIFKTYML